MLTFYLVFIAFLRGYSADDSKDEKRLIMVNAIFRHGARAPLSFYPNDPYQEKYWVGGAGQLTQKGMNIEYQLGKFYKERYAKNTEFISKQYRHKEVKIYSSDKDRCIQSALAVLAGLYPPTGYQIWSQEIPTWQPIPVHTIPKGEDVLIDSDPWSCPRLLQLWKEERETAEYKNKVNHNLDLLKTVSDKSGMKVNAETLYEITDAVKCERAEGLKVPAWIDDIWDKVSAFDNWIFAFKFSGNTNDEIGKLLGGPLLATIIHDMNAASKRQQNNDLYKLNLWSGHDNTVMGLCAALGLKCQQPPFGASIMVELYHSKKNGFTVEIGYRKDSSDVVEKWKLKDCEESCPLAKFLELSKARTTTERKTSCMAKHTVRNLLTAQTMFIGFLLCMCVIVVFISISKNQKIHFCKRFLSSS